MKPENGIEYLIRPVSNIALTGQLINMIYCRNKTGFVQLMLQICFSYLTYYLCMYYVQVPPHLRLGPAASVTNIQLRL